MGDAYVALSGEAPQGPLPLSVGGVDVQAVVEEIEVDRENRVGAHGAGGDAAPGHVERDVPPVVASGAGPEPDLADHLRESVYRG